MTDKSKEEDFKYDRPFYKANRGNTFRAFSDDNLQAGGFARDLFVDRLHWDYSIGKINYIDPMSMGLNQFGPDGIFPYMFETYRQQIIFTFEKTKQYLEQTGYDTQRDAKSEPK